MNVVKAILVCIGCLAATCPAYAEEPSDDEAPEFALGATFAVESRREYGSAEIPAFVPELVFHHYRPLVDRMLYLRIGSRVGVTGISRPNFARGFRQDEWGGYLAGEIGLVLDWVVLPTVALGVGPHLRYIDFDGSDDFENADSLDRLEAALLVYATLSVGIPIERGAVVLEPFVRVFHVSGDDRAFLRGGVEITFGF